MSNKDNITARQAFSALLDAAADAELNPFALWRNHKSNQESKPVPASKAAAQREIENARAELERAKEFAKLYKLTDGCVDQIKGLAEAYERAGQSDIAEQVMSIIPLLVSATRMDD